MTRSGPRHEKRPPGGETGWARIFSDNNPQCSPRAERKTTTPSAAMSPAALPEMYDAPQ